MLTAGIQLYLGFYALLNCGARSEAAGAHDNKKPNAANTLSLLWEHAAQYEYLVAHKIS